MLDAARTWVESLELDPRQSPSRLATPDFPYPGSGELRSAYLIDADAFVVYVVDGENHARILFVGRHPPAGLDVP